MDTGKLLPRIDTFAVLSFTIPLFVYLLTLAPSVTFFDSGEFITATYSLGSAHSPGYPLFLNYAKPFTYIPFGNIAFRVNIATAVSAALACYGVYLLASHLLAGEELTADSGVSCLYRKAIPLCAALVFAFSPRLWLQSNHDKPYPLVTFLAAMVFYLLLLWRDSYRQGEEHPAYVYLGAFLCGLAFGAHQTVILLIPSYAFLILAVEWRAIMRFKEMLLAFTFALLGFSVHLHLPVRATRNPLLNWGDAKTLSQFLWHFLRHGYPVEKPARDLSLTWAQMNAFNVSREYTLVGVLLLLIGACAFSRKRRDEVLAYLIGIIFFLVVIVGYLNTPSETIFLTEEFFTPMYMLSAVFIGLGLFFLLRKVLCFLPKEKLRSYPVHLAAMISILALPMTVCALHYVENDQHDNYIAYDYASNTLRTLPQEAVLFTWGDSGAFPLWYLQGVERMREDLDLLHTPHLVFNWYLDGFPKLFTHSVLRTMPLETLPPDNILRFVISEQLPQRPVYIDFSTRYSINFNDYTLQQSGICYRVEKWSGTPFRLPEIPTWSRYVIRGVSGDMFFRDLDTSKAILIYANSHLEEGELLLRFARKEEGVQELKIAASIAPELGLQVGQILAGYGIK